MATDQIEGIAAGSIPYGERQNVEAALAGQAAPAPEVGPGNLPVPEPEDDLLGPEEFLAQGAVSDLPITSGLNAGPGPGPALGIEATDEQRRLQEIALNSESAALRYMAALALRRIYERQKRGL